MNALESLLLNGAVFKLSVRIPSGKHKIDWQKLGINADVVNPELVTSGQMYTVPKDTLSTFYKLRARANSVIESHGVPFSVGTLIPNDRIDSLKTELNKIEVAFFAELRQLKDHYDELKSGLLAQWHNEAVSLCAENNMEESRIFEVMHNIEQQFPPWSKLERKFSFSYDEYHDFNKMAEEFIRATISEILSKMLEYSESLREKLEANRVSERNIAPIRRWIESTRQAMTAFQSETVNRMLADLEVWTEEGVAEEVRSSDRMKQNLQSVLSGIAGNCIERVDEIAKESVKSLTSQKRVVQRKAS